MIQVSQSVVGVKDGQDIKLSEKTVIKVNDRIVSGLIVKKDYKGKVIVQPKPK